MANEERIREAVEAWAVECFTQPDSPAIVRLITALASVECEECAKQADDLRFWLLWADKLSGGREYLPSKMRAKIESEIESLRAELAQAHQRSAELEAMLRDAPDDADLDAAVFEANRLAGELARAKERIAELESAAHHVIDMHSNCSESKYDGKNVGCFVCGPVRALAREREVAK